MNNQSYPKVMFINHFSVSGATLLFSLFDSHPNVLIIPAFLDFPRFWKNNKLSESASFSEVVTCLSEWESLFEKRNNSQIQNVGSNKDESICIEDKAKFLGLLIENWNASYISWPQLFFLVHDVYCQYRGVRTESITHIVCHPHGFENIHEMAESMPDSKVLHIIRDPRAANYSYKRTCAKIERDMDVRQLLLGHKSELYFSYLPMRLFAIAKQRNYLDSEIAHKVIRFEDLHINPTELMKDVANWMELNWDDSLMKSSFLGHPWGGNAVDGQPIYAFSREKAESRLWLEGLSRIELVSYDFLCKRYLQKFEYDYVLEVSVLEAWTSIFKLYLLKLKQSTSILIRYLSRENPNREAIVILRFILLEVRFPIAFLRYFIQSR